MLLAVPLIFVTKWIKSPAGPVEANRTKPVFSASCRPIRVDLPKHVNSRAFGARAKLTLVPEARLLNQP